MVLFSFKYNYKITCQVRKLDFNDDGILHMFDFCYFSYKICIFIYGNIVHFLDEIRM